MSKRLTAVGVRNAQPFPGRRREIPDPGCPSLYLIVQPSGRKSWAVRYRHAGKPQKLTIGSWPRVSLEHARRDATAALLQLRQGADPAAAKNHARAAADLQARDTVANLATQYFEKHVRVRLRPDPSRQWKANSGASSCRRGGGGSRGPAPRRYRTGRDRCPLGNGTVPPKPVLANRVLATIRKFFNWLASRDVIIASPCVGVTRPSEEHARDRYLDDAEIAQLWSVCAQLGYPTGSFIRLLLLTGARRSEVGGMRWSEINAKSQLWELPAARTKNARAHAVPLSAQAEQIIAAAPRIVGSEFVFGTHGVTSFGRAKVAVDAKLHLAKAWTLHDLRRTVASGMQRIGVQVPVIEAVLNHRSGSFAGIAGVYQRHSYDREKADALQRWADHVDRAVAGEQPGNVQQLRRC